MIAKGCPKCDQQVPVACKACPCGHSFFQARRTSRVLSPDAREREGRESTSSSSYSLGATPASATSAASASSADGDDLRRRTQRVRREKPDYYDALEYDKQVKKTRARNSECDDEDYICSKRDGSSKPRKKKVKKEEDDDDDLVNSLSAEKQLQCSLILAELNRKMQLVTWKPT